MREDVREAQQQRRMQATPFQGLHNFQHIHSLAFCDRQAASPLAVKEAIIKPRH